MNKVYLISLSDLKEIRPIAETDQSRIDTYIYEAQMNDIRPLLGEAFYYDFISKVFDTGATEYADYQKLLNGGVYDWDGGEVLYNGLKICLSYYTLARYVTNNPVNFTSYGVVTKVNQQSQPIETRSLSLVAGQLRDTAKSFESSIRQFIEVNINDYPNYRFGKSINSPGGFSFFKG